MLNHQTMEKLHALRLTGMAEAYRQQMEDTQTAGLSFEERFGMLVDQHWTWRENQAMARRLKKSKLDVEPCVEDIDFRHPRGLDRSLMRTLITSQWVAQHLSACSRARLESVNPGWRRLWRRKPAGMVHRLIPTGPEAVPGSAGRSRRRQSGPGVGNHRPHGRVGGR
jgi:hypothetical protein